MENAYETPAVTENLLDDVEYTLHQASSGKRFGDYIIDRILFYLIWKFGLVQLAVIVIYFLRVPVDNRAAIFIVSYIMAATSLVLFLAAFEALTKGKTPGKFLMGTRAVNDDGTPITPTTALLRCLSRLTPFEVFSALGSPPYPWHDRWTHTYVIDERHSTI